MLSQRESSVSVPNPEIKKTLEFMLDKIDLITTYDRSVIKKIIGLCSNSFESNVMSLCYGEERVKPYKEGLQVKIKLNKDAKLEEDVKLEIKFEKTDLDNNELTRPHAILRFLKSLGSSNPYQFMVSIFAYMYDVGRKLKTEDLKLFYTNFATELYYYAFPLAVHYKTWGNAFQATKESLISMENTLMRCCHEINISHQFYTSFSYPKKLSIFSINTVVDREEDISKEEKFIRSCFPIK